MDITILPNGNLEIKLEDSDDRDDIEGMRGADWWKLFEDKCGNGWGIVEPEWIGALTDAPIVTDEYTFTDDEKHEVTGRVWWFPNYMVEDPVETLLERGRVVFTAVPEN